MTERTTRRLYGWWIREEKPVYFEVQCRDGGVMTV